MALSVDSWHRSPFQPDCNLVAEQAIAENKRLLVQQKIEAIRKAEESEQTKINQLFIDVENWNKAQVAERYIRAMEKQAILENRMNTNTEVYLAWAKATVNSLNPLNERNWSK